MQRPKNYISQTAAVENLKRLFANNPDSDQLSVEELLIAAARDDQKPQTNRNWLANKMTQMKYHDLIRPVYRYGERKKLVGIELSIRGKKALGRISADSSKTGQLPATQPGSPLGVQDITGSVKNFRDNNPEFDVVFELKLKKPASHNN